jgi:hypothetical protein
VRHAKNESHVMVECIAKHVKGIGLSVRDVDRFDSIEAVLSLGDELKPAG